MSNKKSTIQNFEGKRLLSVEEAARYLNLSKWTVYNRISRNTKRPFPFKIRRLGRLPKFDILDLERYVDSL